jgi:hypothetical protein
MLEGRLLGFRFYFGCRIGSTTSCGPSMNGRSRYGAGTTGPCRATWRWADGLRGLEVARQRTVEFRIHTISKPVHIPNP